MPSCSQRAGSATGLSRPTLAGHWIVAPGDMRRASQALATYDQENRDDTALDASLRAYGETWIGALIAALLVSFFAVTGPREPGAIWFDRGALGGVRRDRQ
jgi:hypothetical protein